MTHSRKRILNEETVITTYIEHEDVPTKKNLNEVVGAFMEELVSVCKVSVGT